MEIEVTFKIKLENKEIILTEKQADELYCILKDRYEPNKNYNGIKVDTTADIRDKVYACINNSYYKKDFNAALIGKSNNKIGE